MNEKQAGVWNGKLLRQPVCGENFRCFCNEKKTRRVAFDQTAALLSFHSLLTRDNTVLGTEMGRPLCARWEWGLEPIGSVGNFHAR